MFNSIPFNVKNKIRKTQTSGQYTLAQLELLEIVALNDAFELAEELMLIHDIALYHSDYDIHEEEKTALYQLKQLSDILKQISREE
jgi:hypothetical protein